MTELDAVNIILPYLGEHTVSTLNSRSPTVSLIQAALKNSANTLLAEGFWFNKQTRKLYPDSSGIIYTPDSMLALYPTGNILFEPRGNKLWDITNSTWYFESEVEAVIIDNLIFEELPLYAQETCCYMAAIELYTKDFGVDSTVQLLQQKYQQAALLLRQENLRKQKYVMRVPGKSKFNHYLSR